MSTSILRRGIAARPLHVLFYIGSLAGRDRFAASLDHFLRKRSSRTTSAPPWFGGGRLLGAFRRFTGRRGHRDGRRARERPAMSRRRRPRRHRTVSNWRPNCTDGSRKLLIALNGTISRSGMPPKDRPTSKRSSSHRQVPELVLEDDRHLFRILRQQPRRQLHALGLRHEGDEEMMLARQAMLGGIGQHLAQHAAQRVAGQHVVADMIGRHGGPVAFQEYGPCRPDSPSRNSTAPDGSAGVPAGKEIRGKWRLLLPGASEPRLTVLNPLGL